MDRKNLLEMLKNLQFEDSGRQELQGNLVQELDPGLENKFGHTYRDSPMIASLENDVNPENQEDAANKLSGLRFQDNDREQLRLKLARLANNGR